jgi:EamA domain-containing membrane protein RarD
VIAPLGSLYPIISVPIAVLFLQEKVGQREIIAIICALASVAALSWEAPPAKQPILEPQS